MDRITQANLDHIWNDPDRAKTHIKKISENGFVPGYTQIMRMYGKPFTRNIKKHGGYKKLVSECGLKIANYYKASDGHILSSWYEYLFDEYLFLNGIQHDIDGYIVEPSKCRYDFKIGDVYVEIWGINDAASKYYNNYKARRTKKESIYITHGLKLISFEGADFGNDSNTLQKVFSERLSKQGIASGPQINYPIFNKRKIGYWCDQTIIKEIKDVIDKIGGFPTANQLGKIRRFDLTWAIVKFGGYRKFAELLGYTPQTKEYSEQRLVEELKSITKQLGHFPADRELQEMNRSDLAGSIKTHGGYGHFKEKVVGAKDKKPFGYWAVEENIVEELLKLQAELGRFPKYSELGLIAKGIDRSRKGMNYFNNKLNGTP